MKTEVKKYDLKDFSIFNSDKKNDFYLWQPEEKFLILGRANNAEDSLIVSEVQKDNIKVYKRPSGGEAVILTPNTIVISVKIEISNEVRVHHYFKEINDKIISALSGLGIENLKMKGISDISIDNKKILGSSIYRKRNILFYHAVLNISESAEVIAKYLKQPEREPDYREGRSHKEFVTSLKAEGYDINVEGLIPVLIKNLSIN